MALTPDDVVTKQFQHVRFKEGFDPDEVDDFLDEIVVELRRLNQENDELRKKLAESGAGTPASSAAAAPVVEKVPAPVKSEKEDRAKAEAARRRHIQDQLDAALADTLPASDPVSIVISQHEEAWEEPPAEDLTKK